MPPTPLYATTSELWNEVWGKRSNYWRAPAAPEPIPEPMTPFIEEPESPPLTPLLDPPAAVPLSPVLALMPQTLPEKGVHRARSAHFSLFKYSIILLGAGLMTFSVFLYANWLSVHGALTQYLSYFHSSRGYSRDRTSSITYETQATLDHPIKINPISLVLLQAKFTNIVKDLDSDLISVNLKHTEVEYKELSQRVKHSSLPNKDLLVEQLSSIASATKGTRHDFQKFSSHVGGTLDQITSVNRYILREFENIGDEPVRGVEGSSNRFASALLKSGTSKLLQEVDSSISDFDGIQNQLDFARGIVGQLQQDCEHQRTQNKSFALLAYIWANNEASKDFDDDQELLEEARASLEQASLQTQGVLSLLHQTSNDLRVVHDQLSTASLDVDSL